MNTKTINQAIFELNRLKFDCLDRNVEISNIFTTLNKIVLGFYCKKNRFYHNLSHVLEVVQYCRKYAIYQENFLEIILAAWFHDIIYSPNSDNNEALSARIFERIFLKTNMMHETISKIKQYILHTKNHLFYINTKSAILLDADLKILSSSRKKYLKYCLNIQKEYSHLELNDYKKGRKIFLEKFLKIIKDNNGIIYNHLPKHYNNRAINNIYNELKNY